MQLQTILRGSALEFDLSMDTSYLYQRFVIEGVWGAASNDIYFQSRRASDNTYFTGSNSYAWTAHGYGNGQHGGNSSNGDTKGRIVYHGIGNANTEKSKFIFDIYDCHVSGRQTHFNGSRTGWHYIAWYNTRIFSCYRNSNYNNK